jgi:hypothetical protein
MPVKSYKKYLINFEEIILWIGNQELETKRFGYQ